MICNVFSKKLSLKYIQWHSQAARFRPLSLICHHLKYPKHLQKERAKIRKPRFVPWRLINFPSAIEVNRQLVRLVKVVCLANTAKIPSSLFSILWITNHLDLSIKKSVSLTRSSRTKARLITGDSKLSSLRSQYSFKTSKPSLRCYLVSSLQQFIRRYLQAWQKLKNRYLLTMMFLTSKSSKILTNRLQIKKGKLRSLLTIMANLLPLRIRILKIRKSSLE